jgi:hypothetical protein
MALDGGPERPALEPFYSLGRGSRHGPRALIAMLEVAISLIVGFALGYGVREWAFRQSSGPPRRRRPF